MSKQDRYQEFVNAIIETFGGGEEAEETLRDVARGGADAGWPGFSYYRDTEKWYDEYEDVIWEMLEEDADGMGVKSPLELIATFGGAKDVHNDAQFKNLLVWYALERVAGMDHTYRTPRRR